MPDARHETRNTFRRRDRLTGASGFAAVFAAAASKPTGPLVVRARPNGLGRHRLGLAVPRRVGKAHRRQAIKRRLREAFRLARRRWPGGYDIVIVARPHEPRKPAEYGRLLEGALIDLDRLWRRRACRAQQRQQQQ